MLRCRVKKFGKRIKITYPVLKKKESFLTLEQWGDFFVIKFEKWKLIRFCLKDIFSV